MAVVVVVAPSSSAPSVVVLGPSTVATLPSGDACTHCTVAGCTRRISKSSSSFVTALDVGRRHRRRVRWCNIENEYENNHKKSFPDRLTIWMEGAGAGEFSPNALLCEGVGDWKMKKEIAVILVTKHYEVHVYCRC